MTRMAIHLRRLALVAMICLAAPLPAFAEKVLHRGNGAEPETLDPHKSSGVPESWIQYDLFEGLLTPDGKGGFLPGAAERWEVSADGTVYTFHLRRNAKWSDGTPVTAADWVFSWRRAVAPATASDYAFYLWRVKNAEDVTFGKKKPEEMGVRAVDDHTFEVTLVGPTPYFPKILHHHASYALSKANVEKYGDDFIRPGNLVSNGAYRLAESVPQSHVKLVKNPYFHDAAEVRIDTVYFYNTENLDTELRRFRAGELHLTYEVPVTQTKLVKETMAADYRSAPYFGSHFYAPNLTKEPWKSNRDLRLALSLALDRDVLAEKIMGQGEKGIFSFVPPGIADYQPPVMEWAGWTQAQREARAKELLQKAGYGPGGKPLELEVLYNTSENHRKVAIAAASMWQSKLGVKVTLNNQEWKVFLNTRDEKAFKDIVRHGWIGDYLDPYSFLELLRSDVGQQNPTGYANPDYDRLVREANNSLDPARRTALLQQAEKLALEDVALIPLMTYASQHMVSPKVVGWTDNLLDLHPSRFLDLKD
ncbi:peptide ABC transporter substrate-binding protein [Oleisolibacter albus]|uniref:peptide ABC transporter substrate-binding protein n=1 Tax=Oleisolibacter albus TaxID=2171757 RepID=UPI001EFE6CEA|nr:peptide ABC transporter substrate-binding protein [Oleisolibacter albus]